MWASFSYWTCFREQHRSHHRCWQFPTSAWPCVAQVRRSKAVLQAGEMVHGWSGFQRSMIISWYWSFSISEPISNFPKNLAALHSKMRIALAKSLGVSLSYPSPPALSAGGWSLVIAEKVREVEEGFGLVLWVVPLQCFDGAAFKLQKVCCVSLQVLGFGACIAKWIQVARSRLT